MVKAKLEKERVKVEFSGSTPGIKAEMAYLLKNYREVLERNEGNEKAGKIYQETLDLSKRSEEEIQEVFERDFIRELREMLGARTED